AISKFPLVTKSTAGFLVNRVLAPYMMSAMLQYEQGDERDRIDAAAKQFGMPVGPLELADQVGLDICLSVAQTLELETGGEGAKIHRLIKAGKLGKKSGEGFYKWQDGKVVPGEKAAFATDELEQLGHKLIEPLVSECKACLAEGVVDSPEMVDAGVIFGTGFAPFRGGPLHYEAARTGETFAASGAHSADSTGNSMPSAAQTAVAAAE
ncbi:MAG: 3-hydroxyacyl-CoA dehydrogenase family protein, partial [Pseudomonadota bacterium]